MLCGKLQRDSEKAEHYWAYAERTWWVHSAALWWEEKGKWGALEKRGRGEKPGAGCGDSK